jgi:predicted nucleic acid-binding protein
MILLDTNVVSELAKAAPDEHVVAWLVDEPTAGLFISTITEAELRYGVALLAAGRRRDRLTTEIENMLTVEFADRILPFDSSAAIAYAEIAAARRQSGRPISQFDAQIAAIARSRGAALATRNVADFSDCGIKVINPWNAKGS